ncbi:cobalamin B12-binding domain-containing protein [Paenibacillus lutrae]|uniref:Cobalamin-binding protein n=1 Tax=Paenibacillus lutrae TaxID=2078573 RepID=A0A7X3JZA6_9BACL|nr:cobalamin-dependent protein [Paenibacillus lutrae]MVO99844.1 cobalamin-binding protein [Paenibacillus lutrae]
MNHEDTGRRLLRMADELAEYVTHLQYQLQPDLMDRFGERGRQLARQDSNYSIRYLAESIHMQSPDLFSHYTSWAVELLAGYKLSKEDMALNYQLIEQAVNEHFDEPDRNLIVQYVHVGLNQMQSAVASQSFLTADQPLADTATAYTNALLRADRREALQLVLDRVEAGIPITDLYLHVFQPSQREIGRLWQTNQISVAQEHLCTAATQMVMSHLYPYLFATKRNGGTMVAACVGEELHEIGLRMVSDLFELNGWDTYYLGANVPSRSLIRTLVEKKANIVAISATMTFHVHLVEELIAEIRSSEAGDNVHILVGGLPFNIDRELWRKVGADGYANDAQEAIRLAEHWKHHRIGNELARPI